MMKRIKIQVCCLTALLIVGAINGQAQTFDEWFNQKKTQTKYLIQQIAALEVYLDYLEKGYDITRDGLNLIGDIKNGEFNLHKDYFNSLKTVNPKIKKYPRVKAMLSMQSALLQQYQKILHRTKAGNQFTGTEINYIKAVYQNLLEESTKDLEELQLVISDGALEMTDAERIKKINALYDQVQDRYSFSNSFSGRVLQLAATREQRKTNMEILKKLYDR